MTDLLCRGPAGEARALNHAPLLLLLPNVHPLPTQVQQEYQGIQFFILVNVKKRVSKRKRFTRYDYAFPRFLIRKNISPNRLCMHCKSWKSPLAFSMLLAPEVHIKRQVTRHDCLARLLGDGEQQKHILNPAQLPA